MYAWSSCSKGGSCGDGKCEKNRAKVEKKFNVEELEGIVDKEGLAMFFNSGEIVGKSKSKRKEEELSCLVKYSLINKLKHAPNLVDFSVCKL